MTLVESIRCEFLPIAPYLVEHHRVVTILDTSIDELWFHLIDDFLLLLTHRLTEGIALASGEVGKQSRQKHDLLLIHCDAIGVLEVLLHHRYVVGDRLTAMLTCDELRDVIHRTWAIESIHCHDIANAVRLEFTQVLLHTRAFELERSHRSTSLEEPISLLIVDRDIIHIYFHATGLTNIIECLVDDTESLESEEVHLDQACRFDDMSVVLRHEQLCSMVIDHRHRHNIGDWVSSDDHTAGMNTCTSHIALEHLTEFHHVAYLRIWAHACVLKFAHYLDAVLKVAFHCLAILLWHSVRDESSKTVGLWNRHLLDTRHILEHHLGGHRTIGDDVRNAISSIFVLHPFDDLGTSVIIEVCIDIGQ